MPKLPTNMVTRPKRPGYWYRRKINGKTQWRSLGKDYEEARRLLRKMQGESSLLASELSVRAAVARWLDGYIRNSRAEKGRTMAAVRARKYLEPEMGAMLLRRVTREHVRAYRIRLEERGLMPRTVAHLLGDARCFFRWCADEGLIDRSPVPLRIMPRIQETPPDRLTDAQADQLRALPGRHGFVCRLALATGLRWGELTRAQAADIERECLVVHHTKSGKVRRVPLSPEILAELRMRVGLLVPYAPKSPGSFAKAIRNRTGISGFHVHQLRHTFACQWLERGGSLPALQQILGHAEITTTQRYARLSDEAVFAEARRIGSGGVSCRVSTET